MTSLFDTTYTAYLLRKRIGAMLFAVVILSSVVYGILIKQTISHVVERKQLQQQQSALHSELAVLESEYITLTEFLTEDNAHARGFVTNPQVHYALRSTTPDVVTLRGIE